MLTRLEVHGFKNLLDLSIDFGTCPQSERTVKPSADCGTYRRR